MSISVSSVPQSLFISSLVHSLACCCWPCGPCWPTIELIGSENGALFDQSRTARLPSFSKICCQFSRISIWMLRPAARHISTSICAVATWFV